MRIFIFVVFAIVGCSQIEADEQQLKLVWDYNTPADSVIHYNVFIYESEDTLNSPFADGGYADSIRQYQVASADEDSLQVIDPDSAVYRFTSPANGWWIQAAITAVNQWGESNTSVSAWHKKRYQVTPAKPQNVRIRE